MDDARVVRLGERLHRLQQVADRLVDRQARLAEQPLGEILAVEVLHHHVGRAVFQRADVAHLRDVIALDAGCSLRLALEAGDVLRILGGFDEQELDRHHLVQARVPSGHDAPHATHAEHAFDLVLAHDDIAWSRNAFQLVLVRHVCA